LLSDGICQFWISQHHCEGREQKGRDQEAEDAGDPTKMSAARHRQALSGFALVKMHREDS
jgi:hypothetical protein